MRICTQCAARNSDANACKQLLYVLGESTLGIECADFCGSSVVGLAPWLVSFSKF